jgi:hypothetical protein
MAGRYLLIKRAKKSATKKSRYQEYMPALGKQRIDFSLPISILSRHFQQSVISISSRIDFVIIL